MAERVCPVWMGYVLAFPLRKLYQNPDKILAPYVREGMTAIDIGSAMGFFSLPLARLVGDRGRVVCLDVQEQMLASLRRRAARAGLDRRIETRLCRPEDLAIADLAGRAQFALAFAVVHETPDAGRLFEDIFTALEPGGALLFAEPQGHVDQPAFEISVSAAAARGFGREGSANIRGSRAAVLRKPRAR
jgi:predicted O-methyltransferase YrrM